MKRKDCMIIYRQLTSEQAHEYALVLKAAGIEYRRISSDDGWDLWVPSADGPRAIVEIEDYRDENHPAHPGFAAEQKQYPRSFYGLWLALFLLVADRAIHHYMDHGEAVRLLGASATAITNGQWYRCVTALMVHAGPLHLLANMVSMALFASVVASLAGWGLATAMITAAGIIGNFANASAYGSGHHSIGASTAVFGAIGILVVYQAIQKIRQPEQRWRAVLPIGAGFALLGMLSAGLRVDVMAHLWGMLSGAAIATPCFFWWHQMHYGIRQWPFVLASAAVVGISLASIQKW